jgi:Rap1a immunity proteins
MSEQEQLALAQHVLASIAHGLVVLRGQHPAGDTLPVPRAWVEQWLSQARAAQQDGNELLTMCTDAVRHIDAGYNSDTPRQVSNYGRCLGYVEGVVEGDFQAITDMRTMYKLPVPGTICLPRGVGLEQLIRIVTQSLREHPPTLYLRSSVLVVNALSLTFPCQMPDPRCPFRKSCASTF